MIPRTSIFVKPGAADSGFAVYMKKAPRGGSRIGVAMKAAREGQDHPARLASVEPQQIHPALMDGLRRHLVFRGNPEGVKLVYADPAAAPWLLNATRAEHFKSLMSDRVGVVEALEGAYAREGIHFVVQDDAVFFFLGEDLIRGLDHYTTPRKTPGELLADTESGKYFALRAKAVRIIRKDVHVLELEFPYGTSFVFSDAERSIAYPKGYLGVGDGLQTRWARLPRGFLLDANGHFTFQAGNSLRISAALGKNHVDQRSFTIATHPGSPYLDVVFNLVPGGMMSHQLFSLDVDDVVFVHSSAGSPTFRLFEQVTGPQIFVTTGTGIAAPRAMVPELFKPPGIPHPVIIISGNKYQNDHLSVRYFGELMRYHPELHVLNVSSRDGGRPWQEYATDEVGERGMMKYAQHVLVRLLTGHAVNGVQLTEEQVRNANIYFCGRPEMIQDAEAELARIEFPLGNCRKDIFV